MLRRFSVLCMLLAAGTLTASADITVYLNPVDAVIGNVGGTAAVEIKADIPEADAILGWGLDLNVADTGIANWALVGIGTQFDAWYAPDGDGLAGLVRPEFRGLWGTGILLATVEFTGYAEGLTGVALGANDPLNEGFALDPMGFAVAMYGTGSVEVLPEPASLCLLALAALALRRR